MATFVSLIRLFIPLTFLCIQNVDSASVRVDIDTSKASDLANFGSRIKKEMEDWFPYMADKLKSPGFTPPSYMKVYFDPEYTGPNDVAKAEWQSDRIVGNPNYYRKNNKDVGSMIHEMVHMIQRYKNGCPWYFTEGIADYYRFFHYEPQNKPGKPGRNQNYDAGYQTTAYFLNYVNTKVRSDMVYYLNKDCREGKYKDDIWTRLTGKTPKTLWEDMQRNG